MKDIRGRMAKSARRSDPPPGDTKEPSCREWFQNGRYLRVVSSHGYGAQPKEEYVAETQRRANQLIAWSPPNHESCRVKIMHFCYGYLSVRVYNHTSITVDVASIEMDISHRPNSKYPLWIHLHYCYISFLPPLCRPNRMKFTYVWLWFPSCTSRINITSSLKIELKHPNLLE